MIGLGGGFPNVLAAFLLLLPIPLSACILPMAECAFVVPAPTHGATFVFETGGTYWSLDGPARAAETTPENPSLVFGPGDLLKIKVAPANQEALTLKGNAVEASSLHYSIVATNGTERVFREEDVDAQTSRVVRIFNPLALWFQGRAYKESVFGLIGLPAALGFSIAWERSVDQPALQAQFALPFISDNASRMPTYEIEMGFGDRRVLADGTCAAAFSGTVSRTPKSGTSPLYALAGEWHSGVAVPSTYEFRRVSAPTLSMGLRLVTATSSGGASLAPFVPILHLDREKELSGGDVTPFREGFPDYSENPFPTGLREALELVRGEESARAWFREHPAAVASSATHRAGAPGSSKVDVWEFGWHDSGAGATARVTRERPTIPLTGDQLRAQFWSDRDVKPAAAIQVGIRIEAMARLVRVLHGGELEYMSCVFYIEVCLLGTHERTGKGYAGSTGISVGGIAVSPDRGIILNDVQLA